MTFSYYFIISFVFIAVLAISVWYSILLSRFGSVKLPKNLPYADLQSEFSNKIAIVIPTRNEEDNITTVLNSMMNQTFTNFTVVVTDRSSDSTLRVAKEFYDKNMENFSKKNINLILLAWDESKNFRKGRIGQFNHAFSILPSSIEFIGYADADGQYTSDWLFCLAYGISKGYDLVSSGFVLSKKTRISDHMDNLDNQFVVISGQSAMKLGTRGWMFGASVLYKRKSYDDIHGYEGIEHIIMDDFALANKFFVSKKKVGYFNDKRALVKVAPVPSPIKQKIRWSSANWADANFSSKLVTLAINLFPLIFYVLTLISLFMAILLPGSADILGVSFLNMISIGILMFILDFSVVLYLFIITKVNPFWLPFYMVWISIVARPIVLYSYFKRQVNWKQENVITNKVG